MQISTGGGRGEGVRVPNHLPGLPHFSRVNFTRHRKILNQQERQKFIYQLFSPYSSNINLSRPWFCILFNGCKFFTRTLQGFSDIKYLLLIELIEFCINRMSGTQQNVTNQQLLLFLFCSPEMPFLYPCVEMSDPSCWIQPKDLPPLL